LDGRRWSDGLHQSIEAREGIAVSQQSQVIAKVTYQALFRQFSRLSGMTGTAMTDAAELELTYGLKVTPVPTALPIARRDYPDVCFKTRAAADEAIIKEVVNVGGGQPDGRPCLIGTTSVVQSEMLLGKLAEKGIKAELLNGSPKNAPRESELVAQAGRAGVVTVATNIAGRGTDILLGGCSKTMSRIKTRSFLVAEGVISKEEANKLPPSPPEEYYPCSLDEDSTFMLKEAAAAMKKEFPSLSAFDLDEILTVATDTTEAEEDPDYIVTLRDAAEAVREAYTEVTDGEKELVQSAGGLYVMGTNRHESSRIDNQLRGRAGRQGDPGTSRFFLSFEDDMFVIFGGDKFDKILKMFRVSDDMPVEAPQVTEALDKVQLAVEQKYREIRGEIFKFDEVLNGQRKVIYKRRRDILFNTAEAALEQMKEYNSLTVADIVKAQTAADGSVDVDKVLEKMRQFFPLVGPVVMKSDLEGKSSDAITSFITIAVDEIFNAQAEELDKKAVAAGKEPFSLGRSAKYITLVTMDNAWSEHLKAMENLKEVVVLRKFQGLDPLEEYRGEAFKLFEGVEKMMRFNAVFSLWQSLVQNASVAA
jgi:preprotein translocase subunit SecA